MKKWPVLSICSLLFVSSVYAGSADAAQKPSQSNLTIELVNALSSNTRVCYMYYANNTWTSIRYIGGSGAQISFNAKQENLQLLDNRYNLAFCYAQGTGVNITEAISITAGGTFCGVSDGGLTVKPLLGNKTLVVKIESLDVSNSKMDVGCYLKGQ